jgi:hypothetical protein
MVVAFIITWWCPLPAAIIGKQFACDATATSRKNGPS